MAQGWVCGGHETGPRTCHSRHHPAVLYLDDLVTSCLLQAAPLTDPDDGHDRGAQHPCHVHVKMIQYEMVHDCSCRQQNGVQWCHALLHFHDGLGGAAGLLQQLVVVHHPHCLGQLMGKRPLMKRSLMNPHCHHHHLHHQSWNLKSLMTMNHQTRLTIHCCHLAGPAEWVVLSVHSWWDPVFRLGVVAEPQRWHLCRYFQHLLCCQHCHCLTDGCPSEAGPAPSAAAVASTPGCPPRSPEVHLRFHPRPTVGSVAGSPQLVT